MNWVPVNSSTIARMAYNEPRRVLAVEFKSGSRYEYYDVSVGVFQQMTAASSKGRFLASRIKGQYRYARV